MIAAPQPAIRAEQAQPKTEATAIEMQFRELARAIIAVRGPKPKHKPKKKSRSGEDERRLAFVRKHTRRLWRKVANRFADDERDDRPTYDPQWWHRHKQSLAVNDNHQQEHGARQTGPRYSSLTL
jgi:hypothetical protein